MKRLYQGLLAGLTALLLASCRQEDDKPAVPTAPDLSPNVKVFAVKGVVRGLDPAHAIVHIEHEAIPDYMEEMTMPFDVKNTNELAGLLVGDAISFRLLVTDTEGWIDQIVKIPLERVSLKAKPRPPVRVARVVEPLEVGDLIPDYPFTNELGQPISLHEFQGGALGLTFIFTRCPYPNFCPRMSANFAEACRQLLARAEGPTNWHLLSISFDPDYDTPAVLRAYAEGYAYNPDRWSFATGAMIDIDAITEQFEMMFAPDGPFFSHNVRTAVIDARGRVQRIFVGNEWKVPDFVAEMVKAASVKEPLATPGPIRSPGSGAGPEYR